MHAIDRGSRRRFVAGLVSTGIAGLAFPALEHSSRAQSVQPTPACADGDEPTAPQTEGPFFSPYSPERAILREAGISGTPITLRGFVLTRSCRPVSAALVELWHSDNSGEYDNVGFRLRGHQFTTSDGSYAFETIVPGIYPGRTRHFHLKFQAPGERVLTTQFYFPGEPANERDSLFDPALLLEIDGRIARFDTVLDIS